MNNIKKYKTKLVHMLTEIKPYLLKAMPLLLVIVGAVLSKKIEIQDGYDVPVVNIIVSLLPMIFTIITIALSLPSEKIFGVTSLEFRRIREKINFSFLEMILCTILIFLLEAIFEICDMTIAIWSLDCVSIVYSIWFVVQEIPILTHSNKHLIKIVNSAWKHSHYQDLQHGNDSNDKLENDILQYLVLNQGIAKTYNSFKTNNQEQNKGILDKLLSKNTEYLFECVDNVECFASSSVAEYKGTNLISAIDMSFENVDLILRSNDDFNISIIYNDSKVYYHVTRMVFCLRKIAKALSLEEKFSNKMQSILRSLFFKLSYSKLDDLTFSFVTGFINAMLVTSVSEDKTWFLELLRDSNYNSMFFASDNIDYYYFISMYLFYIAKNDKKVPEELKKNIDLFLKETAQGLNADGSSWVSLFNHKLDYDSFADLLNILPNVLKLSNLDYTYEPWYRPKLCVSWSSSDGEFSRAFLMNCWLEIVIYNFRSFNYDSEALKKLIFSLDKDDQYALAETLNKRWFIDNSFKDINKEESFLSFYGFRHRMSFSGMENGFIRQLKDIKNEILKQRATAEIYGQVKTDEELLAYKKILVDGFVSSANKLTIFDKTIPVEDNLYCYNCLFDTRWSGGLIEHYAENFYDAFGRLIYESLANNPQIGKIIINSNNENSKLFSALKDYHYKAGNDYRLYYLKATEEQKELIEKLEKLDIPVPCFTLFKSKDALKINLVCDEGKSYVRKLNNEEINTIIDRDYKIINGLYKYCDSSDDSRSIYISRDELFDLVSKKYFVSQIVFKQALYVNVKEILEVESKEDET